MIFRRNRMLHVVVAGLAFAAVLGCGKSETPAIVMQGSVACGEAQVPSGEVKFVSVDGAAAPRLARIIDGHYRLDARSAVPLGKWRIEVDARKKTGRKVEGFNGFEKTMIDEEMRMGPEVYAGKQSPLVVDVTADFDGQFDITIPR